MSLSSSGVREGMVPREVDDDPDSDGTIWDILARPMVQDVFGPDSGGS